MTTFFVNLVDGLKVGSSDLRQLRRPSTWHQVRYAGSFVSVNLLELEEGRKKVLTDPGDENSKEEGEAQTVIMRGLSEENKYLVAGCDTAKAMMENSLQDGRQHGGR